MRPSDLSAVAFLVSRRQAEKELEPSLATVPFEWEAAARRCSAFGVLFGLNVWCCLLGVLFFLFLCLVFFLVCVLGVAEGDAVFSFWALLERPFGDNDDVLFFEGS